MAETHASARESVRGARRVLLLSKADDHPAPSVWMLDEFVRMCDVGEGDALGDRRAPPSRRQRLVQSDRRGRLRIIRTVITAEKKSGTEE